jgi:hypothetical protein
MYKHKASARQISQRARRDGELVLRAPSPQLPRHGVRVGAITFELFGQKVEAELLATGHHCRSYGVRVDGKVIGVMGADRAWRKHVSPGVRRMMSLRHCLE